MKAVVCNRLNCQANLLSVSTMLTLRHPWAVTGPIVATSSTTAERSNSSPTSTSSRQSGRHAPVVSQNLTSPMLRPAKVSQIAMF